MNNIVTQEQKPSTSPVVRNPNTPPAPYNPFARMHASHVNAGTIAIESERAIADSQVKMLMAQRFPRDEAAAFARAMEACQRPSLAAVAFYSYPRGGESISGPSIRLAEELARCWGRIEYGIRELARNEESSEMQAYAIDLENLVYVTKNFTVRHVRDRKSGKVSLTDERDIYELTANQGSRRVRACIMAVLPPDLKDAAVEQCRKTIAEGSGNVPIGDRIKRMVLAFGKLGVSDELLVKRLGHRLDQTTPDELADLHGIYSSIKDGVTKIDDWFGDSHGTSDDDDGDAKSGIASVIQKQAAKAAAKQPPAATAAESAAPAAANAAAQAKTKAAQQEKGKKDEAHDAPQKADPPASEPADQQEEVNVPADGDDDGPVF
jgi:Membrane protein involved in colicin uptake